MLKCWPSYRGVPVGNGPILTAISGNVVMGGINQFPAHSLVFAASDSNLIFSMVPWTKLELVQEYVGTIGYGYIINPVKQVTQQSESTITIELPQITNDLMRRRTKRGWISEDWLSTIAIELGGGVPGWSGSYVYTDPNDNFVTQAVINGNPTYLAAFIDTGTQFGQFTRIGRDANGLPIQALEWGQFLADSGVVYQDSKGANAEEIDDDTTKVPITITETPIDVRQLYNVVTPFGGGNDANSLVTLERCWRIINDPKYPNFGRWGSDIDSLNRTGKLSVFTEYDPNYPISDPENPPTGVTQYDANGILFQGAIGTRAFTRDGHSDYIVYDPASYETYGYCEGQYVDSGLTTSDNSPANQETTSKALYIAITTQLKRYAHPHHTVQITAPGTGRPPREGDLVTLDYQRQSTEEDGTAIVEINIIESQRVMSVNRAFNGNEVPIDTIITSNLGRFDDDDGTFSTDAANQIAVVQMRQGTSYSPLFFGPFADNVDAITPIEFPVTIPAELFQFGRCTLRVDFQQFTLSSTTAVNQTQPFTIISPPQDILLDTPNDLNLGGNFNADGSGAVGTTDGFSTDLHVHVYGVNATGSSVGVGNYPQSGGNNAFGRVGNSIDVPVYRNQSGTAAGLDQATTKSGFTTPILKKVLSKFGTIARIAGTTILATLPPHFHPLDQKVGKGPLPVSCTVYLNGVALSSEVLLVNGSRDPNTGAFTTAFEVDDIGKYIEFPGQVVTFKFVAGTNGSNPTGAGRFQITGTWFGQFGSLPSTVRAG